jgi:hypothetical protein
LKLQSIAAKYDLKRVYQTLQPGYFKLDGAPASDSLCFPKLPEYTADQQNDRETWSFQPYINQ